MERGLQPWQRCSAAPLQASRHLRPQQTHLHTPGERWMKRGGFIHVGLLVLPETPNAMRAVISATPPQSFEGIAAENVVD